ncbi:hypothetical protein TWF281_008848 [Arthrobotrys megalospora]
MGIALPQLTAPIPGSPAKVSSGSPTLPPPAVLRDTVTSHSMRAYGQEELAPIDAVPRPAFPRSLSMNMLHEERSQLKCHIRYESLEQRGLEISTVIVGPKRLAALGEWEKLEERAEAEAKHPLPALTQVAEVQEIVEEEIVKSAKREPSEHSAIVPTKPATICDEESLVRLGEKAILNRMANAFRLEKVAKCLGLRRWFSRTPIPHARAYMVEIGQV